MPTATLQRKYEPRSYDLHDLHVISDRTLAMHFKLYEGYVKETNTLTERIHQLVEDGKVDQEEMPVYFGAQTAIWVRIQRHGLARILFRQSH
ncbi:MAG TPA: hypothetical protein VFU48_07150, partial [Nitrospira sp.]|nr:hypothetical protein [Nitrospira sp.]